MGLPIFRKVNTAKLHESLLTDIDEWLSGFARDNHEHHLPREMDLAHPIWTPELDELLVAYRAAGLRWAVVAKRLDKTQEATISRAAILTLRRNALREAPRAEALDRSLSDSATSSQLERALPRTQNGDAVA